MDWHTLIEAQPDLARIPAPLRADSELMEVGAGQVMFRIGDRVKSMMAVICGEVRLIRRGKSGSEVILQRSREGFVAESSLHAKTYHCDVVAAEAGAVLFFPMQSFRTALAEDMAFQNGWLAHLSREVSRLRAHCERLSLRSAAERIFHYIESEGTDGKVVLNHSRKAWANELGLTHEALYRTLSRLHADGMLHIEGNVVAVARLPAAL